MPGNRQGHKEKERTRVAGEDMGNRKGRTAAMVILKYALAVVLGALIGGLVGYHGSCTGSA